MYQYEKAQDALPTVAVALMQNLSAAEVAALNSDLDGLKSKQLPSYTKSLLLGLEAHEHGQHRSAQRREDKAGRLDSGNKRGSRISNERWEPPNKGTQRGRKVDRRSRSGFAVRVERHAADTVDA